MVYNFTATLRLKLRICKVTGNDVLYFYVNTFRSMRAVANLAAFYCPLTSCFPDMLF